MERSELFSNDTLEGLINIDNDTLSENLTSYSWPDATYTPPSLHTVTPPRGCGEGGDDGPSVPLAAIISAVVCSYCVILVVLLAVRQYITRRGMVAECCGVRQAAAEIGAGAGQK